ncbi:hypothetical protein [Methylococcus capsulatus]|jgi:DNA adenine methylase|uniref:DNA adenine methylase n=1 Tax=Methylococcus capsulatus TaxID=414 RepID=A0AA35UA87_METCP|nr:hypothetical protein [Methylococcus capsulatus]CAI8737613.1 protein of unknown function [Methylococcus capsulatus]
MAELARTIQGSMVISVNDIPEMREAFEGLPLGRIGIRYSFGKDRALFEALIIRNRG